LREGGKNGEMPLLRKAKNKERREGGALRIVGRKWPYPLHKRKESFAIAPGGLKKGNIWWP